MSNRANENENEVMNSARFQLRMQRTSAPKLPVQAQTYELDVYRSGQIYGEEYELIVNRPGGLL